MVEGPGATRNGRKVQLAVGKTVVDHVATGSASDETRAPSPTPPSNLVGQTLTDAFTIGKELFLIFTTPLSGASTALRLHFGMNGSLTARKVDSSNIHSRASGIPSWKAKNEPCLRLCFVDENQSAFGGVSTYTIVEVWDSTLTFPLSAKSARTKLNELKSRDACSTSFIAQAVFEHIRTSGNGLIISDALLDQSIFPGVGNIIKIESLHRAKVDPRRIVSSLTDAELRRVIRFSRAYSMDWLKNGRAGTKRVYNQTTCGTCRNTSVKMQKIGGSGGGDGSSGAAGRGHAYMSRVTFWCTICQPSSVASQSSSDCATLDYGVGNENYPNNAPVKVNGPQAQCPQHGTKSIKLCRVRKGNQNVLRIFHTCKIRGCQFFHWADASFSNCRCGKKAILRVSKTERSGGRWFLCCPGDRSSGCGYFEWATDNQLQPLRSLLTPLL